MAGIKRDYGLIYKYLRKYGKAPQVLTLLRIAKEYPRGSGQHVQRWEKYIEYMKTLIESGEIDVLEVYEKMKEED